MSEVKMGNQRSSARLSAVQALYQMDASGSDVEETIEEFIAHRLGHEIEGDQYAPADAAFFSDIVRGVVKHQRELDPQIDEVLASGWPLARVDLTLRQILRAGLFEILHKRDVPDNVAIVEYVDIAQAFFDKGDEPKITNAVLDALAKRIKPTERAGVRG